MALDGGSVTVHTDGSHSGTGLALDLFNALRGTVDPLLVDPTTPQYGMDLADWQAIVKRIKDGFAGLANAFGPAIVGHFVAHAEVAVTTTIGTGGGFNALQRLPPAFVAGDPTVAPASPVALSGTGTVS